MKVLVRLHFMPQFTNLLLQLLHLLFQLVDALLRIRMLVIN